MTIEQTVLQGTAIGGALRLRGEGTSARGTDALAARTDHSGNAGYRGDGPADVKTPRIAPTFQSLRGTALPSSRRETTS